MRFLHALVASRSLCRKAASPAYFARLLYMPYTLKSRTLDRVEHFVLDNPSNRLIPRLLRRMNPLDRGVRCRIQVFATRDQLHSGEYGGGCGAYIASPFFSVVHLPGSALERFDETRVAYLTTNGSARNVPSSLFRTGGEASNCIVK
jgi:hypothetical protein